MSQTVVITGATRGLGRAMVAGFVEQGHTVVGCGRSQGAVEELQREYPDPHAFAIVDVADDRAVQSWAADVLASHGPPGLLINNAALINQPASLWDVSAEEFDTLLRVNIAGVANVIRGFVPGMIEGGRGVIVNFSSGWGRSVSPEVGPYCTTKWAIEGLSKALAAELPPGLACVPLNPGVIDTDMLRTCWGGEAGGFPTPAKWAKRAVPFLLALGPDDNGDSVTVR